MKLEENHKLWKNGFFTLEALIVRSLWEEKTINIFEKKLNLILFHISENANTTFLKNKILISVLFSGDKKITQLNKKYRKFNSPTNVLSFPSFEKVSKNHIFLGNIIFASETISKQAKMDNKSLEDHLIHLFVQGVLNLMGYDHKKNDDTQVKESLEIKILKKLNINNPYIEIKN